MYIYLQLIKIFKKAQQYFVDAELTSMLRSDDSSDSETEVDMLKVKFII